MSPITFTVKGEPVAQPRAMAARIGGFIRLYTPPTAKKWKALVAEAAGAFLRSEGPIDQPLLLTCVFHMPRPKAHFRSNGELKPSAPEYHTGRPDLDNLEKAVMDAITDCGLWRDDSLVCVKQGTKQYANDGIPRLVCTVTPCPDTTSHAPRAAPVTPSRTTVKTASIASRVATTKGATTGT